MRETNAAWAFPGLLGLPDYLVETPLAADGFLSAVVVVDRDAAPAIG
jgi:hypothetical protein